jgi:hypothetical protein
MIVGVRHPLPSEDSRDMSEQDGEAQVRKVLADFAPDVLDLPADEDLIDSRLINSLTFITCIQNLIDVSGREPDLDAVPIERLRTIGGLTEVFFASEAQGQRVPE